jgi:hypothetical protein
LENTKNTKGQEEGKMGKFTQNPVVIENLMEDVLLVIQLPMTKETPLQPMYKDINPSTETCRSCFPTGMNYIRNFIRKNTQRSHLITILM